MNALSTLTIKSLHRDYDVCFSSEIDGLINQLADIKHAFVVIDENIAQIYSSRLNSLLSRYPVYKAKATEETKTLNGVTQLVDWLMAQKAVRSSTIIAIGGGIIQDLVTFTSCVYYRGVDYVLVPTTLLSMCDSSIGAKCGINHGQFKNQLGVVYAPAAVHICTDFLVTLADSDIMSGFGELLKLSLTESESQFLELQAAVADEGIRTSKLDQLIRSSLLTKKRVIELDEYERDFRRVLNYGHTFGHALEALTSYGLPHGLGVAWGIDLVNFLATECGLLDNSIRTDVRDFILQHLRFQLKSFPSAIDLVNATRRDKKVADGSLNLVLLADYGDLRITPTEFNEELTRSVSNYLKGENVFA